MFSKRRHSRPVSTASYTGVSSQSNSPAPASGALAAASVIGKALKDNNHQANGLKLPQQPQKNSQTHRNSSLLGTKRNSTILRSNSVTSGTFRPPTARPGSRSGSLITNGSSPMASSSPSVTRTHSFTAHSRQQQNSQRRVSSDSTYSQFSAPHPHHRTPVSRTSSMGSSSSYQRPPQHLQSSTPSTPKMVKKWVPSANGLVCVEVPSTPQLGTPAQRAIARSSSMNSLSSKSRNQAVKRASSLVGHRSSGQNHHPQGQQQSPQTPTTQKRQQQRHVLSQQNTGGSINSQQSSGMSPFQPPNRGFHTPTGTPTKKQSLKQKASLQSMHTQGQYSMSFEPTILEDEEIREEDEFETVDVSKSDLENLKADYLVELENERLQEEEIERERARNEELEKIERERAFSVASTASVEKITVKADEITPPTVNYGEVNKSVSEVEILRDAALPIETDETNDEIEDESYTETERLLAEQRLEELVKQKELEILAEIHRQKQVESGSGPIKIDSSLMSVVSSDSEVSNQGKSDDTDTFDEEATAHSIEDGMVTASDSAFQEQSITNQRVIAGSENQPMTALGKETQTLAPGNSNSVVGTTEDLKIASLKGNMRSEGQSQTSMLSSLLNGYKDSRDSQEPEEYINISQEPTTPIKTLDPLLANLEDTPSRVSMAKQLRPTLGVVKTPEVDSNESVFSSINNSSTKASNNIGLDDFTIPKRSERRPGSVNNSISSIPSDIMKDLKVTATQVQSGQSSTKTPISSSQSTPQLRSPQLRPPNVNSNGTGMAGRRKSVLKNSNNSSNASLVNSKSAAYLSLTTAENTRLNAMASSSSVNLSQVPSGASSERRKPLVTSTRHSVPVNRNGRQQAQRPVGPTLRNSQASTVSKRQQRLSSVPQQKQQQHNLANHQLAAASKAARQHQPPPISQQQSLKQQHNIQQRRVSKQPPKRSSMYEVQQRQHPIQQQQRPMSTFADPKLRAAELYKKANSKDGFYNNPYPEHLSNMKRTSSFEKLSPTGPPQQHTNGNHNNSSSTKKANRLTLRDTIAAEQAMNQYNGNVSPPSGAQRQTGSAIFKSRFNDSDSDLDVPIFNKNSSNGAMRSSSVQVNPPPAKGNGNRFFSEQINPSKGGDGDSNGEKKKKKFGKLRKLFGSSKKG